MFKKETRYVLFEIHLKFWNTASVPVLVFQLEVYYLFILFQFFGIHPTGHKK